jgi:hypothetical protein
MLLTITTTYQPATDLGYLLHKHPDRCQSFALAFGQASVYYPEAEPARCTAALQLDIDPVRLARRERDAPDTRPLEPYVNDRPYAASSFLSVALAQVYGGAWRQHEPQPGAHRLYHERHPDSTEYPVEQEYYPRGRVRRRWQQRSQSDGAHQEAQASPGDNPADGEHTLRQWPAPVWSP